MTDNQGDPESIELGVQALDAEHRGQLELMEGLEQAIGLGDAAGEIAARLDELIHYLDAHFMSEQLAMREHAYPGYEAHVREHDDAIDLLRKLESRCRSGDGDVAMEILGALRGWLIGHIHTTDHALAEFMKSKGIELH